MRVKDREKAISLRKKGYSVKRIAQEIGAAPGSVSVWVRSVTLSASQKEKLKKHCHSPLVIEKRRQSRLRNELFKKNTAIEEASKDISILDEKMIRVIGASLYWGEGSKSKIGCARITNSDPVLIKMMMRFFREVCKVPDNKFRAHIHIHSTDSAKQAEMYWSGIIGIPTSQFYKTYTIKSVSSKNRRFTLPYGTVEVGVGDVRLHLKIMGWIEGLRKQA